MSENTPNLNLKFVMQNQSQKEVTVNEALLVLDMIHNNGAISIGETTPPASPNDADMYIIGTVATGDWSGKDWQLAYYYTGKGWQFITPKEGLSLWVQSEKKTHIYTGNNWARLSCKNRNLLINGDGIVALRNNTFSAVNNDTYTLDRWLVLSDGNGVIDIAQELSDIPVRSRSAIKSTAVTAAKKFGIMQIIENKNCSYIDKVSLSFKAKGDVSNIRVAILAWDGTADSLTSDAVSAWENAGTNPTLATNWSYKNTPADISITSSYQTIKVENVWVSGSENLAVFIWVDEATTTGDELYIFDVQLEQGEGATGFEIREIAEEFALCERYFQKSYNIGVFAGTATVTGAEESYISGVNNADYTIKHTVKFPAAMRKDPTVTAYSTDGTSAKVAVSAGNVTPSITASENGAVVSATNGASATDRKIAFHYIADGEL